MAGKMSFYSNGNMLTRLDYILCVGAKGVGGLLCVCVCVRKELCRYSHVGVWAVFLWVNHYSRHHQAI